GDIPKYALRPDNSALGVMEWCFDNIHVNRFAAGRAVFLHRLEHFARFNDELVVLLIFCGELSREEIEVRFAENFTQRPSESLAEALVRKRKLLGEILAENVLWQSFDQRMVESF